MSGWSALYIFMLAAFTGYVIIGAVPVILHTPLMSGANFVHGIVLVGAMVTLGFAHGALEVAIGVFAVVLAAMNVHGGYVVTVPPGTSPSRPVPTTPARPAGPRRPAHERRRRGHQSELLRHRGAVHRGPA